MGGRGGASLRSARLPATAGAAAAVGAPCPRSARPQPARLLCPARHTDHRHGCRHGACAWRRRWERAVRWWQSACVRGEQPRPSPDRPRARRRRRWQAVFFLGPARPRRSAHRQCFRGCCSCLCGHGATDGGLRAAARAANGRERESNARRRLFPSSPPAPPGERKKHRPTLPARGTSARTPATSLTPHTHESKQNQTLTGGRRHPPAPGGQGRGRLCRRPGGQGRPRHPHPGHQRHGA